jgi:hypothetical protein
MFVEDILNGGVTDFDPFQSQAIAQLVASPSGMFQADSQDPSCSGGVVRGLDLGMGGKSFKPSIPWV